MSANNSKSNKVRIIAGKWKGRKLRFPDLPELRPTPDRVRETLFNWLAPIIQDATCLDLFAGSGALGFEALSRGAKKVVMIDESQEIIGQLQVNAEIIDAEDLEFHCGTVPKIVLTPQKFDIVFLDPPFKSGLLQASIDWLAQSEYLAKNAHIYIETHTELTPDMLPKSWEVIRDKKAGQVRYYLIKT